jgi:DNA glycosylase AlkZ-like
VYRDAVNRSEIGRRRLVSQHIARPVSGGPAAVVAALGAVQAQDYPAGLWALGLRTADALEGDVTAAIVQRKIVRTWPMRGTLHFVPAAHVRWMLALLTPRVIAACAGRYRQLELDDAAFARSRKLAVRALQGGVRLTRPEMYALFARGGVSPASQRGIHILARLAQEGLICFGPHREKQPTFTLLEEWVPAAQRLDREEALGRLAERYFTGHGPATVHDFAWWSGLTMADARTGIAASARRLMTEQIDGDTHWISRGVRSAATRRPLVQLLPAFDEYLVAYKDRRSVLAAAPARKGAPIPMGMLSPVVVVNGAVVGTWKRTLAKDRVVVTPSLFVKLGRSELRALAAAAERYGRFLERTVELAVT